MIIAEDIKWSFVSSMNCRTKHHTAFRDDELGLQREDITPKSTMKGKSFYFIDNDSREFLNVEDLVKAYNEKFKFSDENPHQEVEWIKVVKQKGDRVIVSIMPNSEQAPEVSYTTKI